MPHTVAVIDGGGRGAVLVEAYSKSPKVNKILAIPGNDLMQSVSRVPVTTYQHLKTTSVEDIVKICREQKVTLVDVAQENASEAGLGDRLEQAGILFCGPDKAASQLEWDKAWARDFMVRHNIPHPKFVVCTSTKQGRDYIQRQKEGKWFIKASGLAEGKGALPAENKQQALDCINSMSKFGEAGQTFLIEDWLEGEEFSTFVISDGKNYKILGSAQDHKRVYNGDQGPNTGGMGCSSPPLLLTPQLIKQIDRQIIAPTIKGMLKLGRPYTGILYVGGIMVGKKLYVIEFNSRWGDPEAQIIVPGIQTDMLAVSLAVANHNLNSVKIRTDKKPRVVIAAASAGYPGDYSVVKGKQIFGLDKLRVYGAGVKKIGKKYYASGGRLFHVVGEGKNVSEARRQAYAQLSQIFVEGNYLHYRTDIGWRDVARANNSSPLQQ